MPRYANTLTRMHISASQQLRGTRSHSGHTFRIIRLRCHRATHRVTDTVGLLYYTPLRLRMRTRLSEDALVVSVSVHTRCAVLPPSLSLATDCDCSRCMVANGVCLPLGIVCRICKKLLMCHGCIGEETQSSSRVRTVTSRTFQRIIGVSARVEIASVAPLGQRGCSINNCARRLSKCSAPDASFVVCVSLTQGCAYTHASAHREHTYLNYGLAGVSCLLTCCVCVGLLPFCIDSFKVIVGSGCNGAARLVISLRCSATCATDTQDAH